MNRVLFVLIFFSSFLLNNALFAGELHVGEGKRYKKIEDAIAAVKSGEIIRIFAGTYFSDKQIIRLINKKNVGIIGDGRVVLSSSTDKEIALISGCDNVLIRNIIFQYKNNAKKSKSPVLVIERSSKINIGWCEFSGSGVSGVSISQGTTIRFTNNFVHNNKDFSISVISSLKILVTSNRVEKNGASIRISKSQKVLVKGNKGIPDQSQ